MPLNPYLCLTNLSSLTALFSTRAQSRAPFNPNPLGSSIHRDCQPPISISVVFELDSLLRTARVGLLVATNHHRDSVILAIPLCSQPTGELTFEIEMASFLGHGGS